MAEQIKELIEKIQEEGIAVSEAKARVIETQAKAAADQIIQKAKKQAQELIESSRINAQSIEQNTNSLLRQAARDLLLSLKKEINAVLQRVIINQIQDVLTSEELVRIITLLIKDYAQKQTGSVIVSVSKQDYERIERDFLCRLSESLKNGIVLRTSEDISAGFTISYDAGKSFFDFSDNALAEYIGGYLKPKLAGILKDI